MAKRNLKKDIPKQTSQFQKKEIPVTESSWNWLPKGSEIISFLIFLMYLGVEFMPGFGGIDDMGFQWFYLVLLDIAVAIYILDRKNDFEFPAFSVLKSQFSKIYLALFVLAGISIFFAINRVEAWVNYVRFISTIVAFFNIAILLYGRIRLFNMLAITLSIILFIQCLQSLFLFFSQIGNYNIIELVLSIKGRAGNKNIFAASLVAKIPFVLYCLYTSKLTGKLLNTTVLFIATTTILIVNARSSYISLFLELLFFGGFCLFQYGKDKSSDNKFHIGALVVSFGFAVLISQFALNIAKDSFVDDNQSSNGYGTLTERLASIVGINPPPDTTKVDTSKLAKSLANLPPAGNNEQRIFLWKHAISYIKSHPVMGCGYGNWKIASIPYTKNLVDDLSVPIHAHNDFLEFSTELGLGGGLLYLSLFIVLLIYTIRTFRSNVDLHWKLMSGFSLLALGSYAVDAFFNFPIERPVNQLYFVLIAACNLVAFYGSRNTENEKKEQEPVSANAKSFFAFGAILLLLPSAYITFLTYQSLVVQNRVIPDLNNEPLKLPINDVINAFPPIPNLSSSAQPIDAVLGRYLYEAKRYKEAITYLDRGAKANPYIMYSEFLKADVYYADNQFDSAFKYASLAYFTKPRAKTYYQTMIAAAARKGDTLTIKKAFATFHGFRPRESLAWNFYLQGMLSVKAKGNLQLLKLADSALGFFPNDKDLLIRRNEIFTNMPANEVNAKVLQGKDVIRSNQLFQEATELFTKGDFANAAEKFISSSKISNGTYGVYENIAICYFNMKQWNQSLPYFDRVMAMKTATDGKTEYFKAAALINLGRKDEACALLQISKSKGYAAADGLINGYCK